MLGTDVTIRDVHDDVYERRQFVREVCCVINRYSQFDYCTPQI
jgi:hypothetical protein